eukprot:scaffold76796_cov56-Phaeocystis_antarctica.AAC.1
MAPSYGTLTSGWGIRIADAPLSRAWRVLWGPTGTPWGRAECGTTCYRKLKGEPETGGVVRTGLIAAAAHRGSSRLIAAHRGSSRLIAAHRGSSRLIAAHRGSSRHIASCFASSRGENGFLTS